MKAEARQNDDYSSTAYVVGDTLSLSLGFGFGDKIKLTSLLLTTLSLRRILTSIGS